MPRFIIQSVLISPSPWQFSRSTATNYSSKLEFKSPESHGQIEHIVTYESDAVNLKNAWTDFYQEVEQFVRAAAFYTSSYFAFQDWRNVVYDNELNVVLISTYSRTLGTALGIYSQSEADNVNKLIEKSNEDVKLKNFLNNYKLALLTDAPETYNSYEKYLLLAAEALAGKVEGENGYLKVDRHRLKKIIGEDLHDFFFQHVDPITGNNIRNLHMHGNESPNSKPSETIKLIGKFKDFIEEAYGIKGMHKIEENASPTRGLHRDDGGLILARPVEGKSEISQIKIEDTFDSEAIIKWLLKGNFDILSLGESPGKEIYMKMTGLEG